jgi:hypothetical protein
MKRKDIEKQLKGVGLLPTFDKAEFIGRVLVDMGWNGAHVDEVAPNERLYCTSSVYDTPQDMISKCDRYFRYRGWAGSTIRTDILSTCKRFNYNAVVRVISNTSRSEDHFYLIGIKS